MKWWVSLAAAITLLPGAALAGEPGDPGEPDDPGDPGEPGEPDDPGEPGPPDGADAPIVELYTMGTGDLLFEKFGHAALCIIHARGPRRTVCYNYGTTDFDSFSSLILDFLRGRSVFWVSTTSRRHMLSAYRETDRTIWRQVLPLAPAQAIDLERLLYSDALEENRYYQYDHYRDNCSSRLRDMLERVTGGALSASSTAEPLRPSYRELTRRGFAGDTALLLLSDLLLGRMVDQRPSTYDAMFLPEVLRTEVAVQLGAEPTVVYERRGPPFASDPGLGGRWLWVVLALAFAAPVAAARRFWRRERLALAAAAMPLALIGLVLWILAVVSSLPELRWNEVLLVFLPTDAALPFLAPLWRTRYAVARIGLLVLATLLHAVGLFSQPLWLLIPMPLLTMLLVALPRRAPAREAAGSKLAAAG